MEGDMTRPAMLVMVAFALVGLSQTPLLANDPTMHPCPSIRTSKFWGRYICSASVTPSMIEWKGKRIAIREAWIEKNLFRKPSVNPFATSQNGYNLCITLSEGWDVLSDGDHPVFFRLKEDERHYSSFSQVGTLVMYAWVKDLDQAEYHVGFEGIGMVLFVPRQPGR
jgi:hypothetical protein